MKINGVDISDAHIAAGLAAMRDTFTFAKVRSAMMHAGCGDEAYRAADRLLQRERKAGRIRAVNRTSWEPAA